MGINVQDSALGGELNPVSNNHELRKAILGRKNCYIYTKSTFHVTEENLYELKIRNIKLVGLAFAYLYKELEKEVVKVTSDISSKGLMSELSKFGRGNK